MEKKLLREIVAPDISILDENKKDGTMKIRAPWVMAGKMNLNKRIYPLPLLNREVDRVREKVESCGMVGMGDHGTSGYSSIEGASHLVQKLFLDKAGKGWTELKILPTERGKTIQEIINAGGQLGISSRGFGTVDPITRIVKDDYKLQGLDIVTNPSADVATFNK